MANENLSPATADKPTEMFDPVHWHERLVQIAMGIYLMCVGSLQVWRALAGTAIQFGQLLWGLLLAAILGPLAIYWLAFQSRSTSQTIPIGPVKRTIGSLAALVAIALGLTAMWMSIFHAEARDAGALGIDWDSLLGTSTIVVMGLYGLYAFAAKGVDVL